MTARQGGKPMRISLTLRIISCLGVAVASIWLFGAVPAWAEGGGADAVTLQGLLDDVCAVFGLPEASCPLLGSTPTDPPTPVVLEISALSNNPLDTIRRGDGACELTTQDKPLPLCPEVAVNAVNAPVRGLIGPFDEKRSPVALSYLTPLAFKPGALPTQYGDAAATSFLYAAVLESDDGRPESLDVFYDLPETTKPLKKGVVATISIPLAVYSSFDGSERSVLATLQLTANCPGANCLTGTISGDFSGMGAQTYSAAQFGIQFASRFARSPNSTTPHFILEVLVPVLVTSKNDPEYFGVATATCRYGANPDSGYCNGFSEENLGWPAAFLGSGKSVGIGPSVAPYPHDGTFRPAVLFSASFFGNPAVAAYFAIDTTGNTLLTTPVSP
jgi:hypothetical protein